ncbi:MAG: glycosyltransferase family 4 protein [Bacteroidaceae bacterium]|jgi:glycosyltransferase involved in cell wall biosynthesis|nr:glycosyltransferase family 4 protein [Bacteroidaceae bacterium]
MRVLIINTSERVGGAAIAANRLMEALKKNGTNAQMLVRDRQTDQVSVTAIKSSLLLPLKFIWERLIVFLNNGCKKANLWTVDIANAGTDVTSLPEFQQADVIHLHWVNQAYLSLKDLRAILESKKTVVVTMHDMWYFTGVCHYSGDCTKYQHECADCPLMDGKHWGIDMAKRVWKKKQNMYARANITFVGCSQWMADMASRSALTKGQKVVHIPNAINTERFCPKDKEEARLALRLPQDQQLILFGAQRITDERKGFDLLVKACTYLKQNQAQLAKNLAIVVVGGDSEKVKDALPFNVYPVKYVSSEEGMVDLYNAVDAYVTPSLQDNLPNTIVEALACGVPCVGFQVGGIPEMIDHQQNGYVADYRNAEDFANGIAWTLDPERHEELSKNAREKALKTYSEKEVARRYMEVYKK